ncbi:MAG: flagellar motor switch protein FliN, partial [Burkholderiaceae bacterium]
MSTDTDPAGGDQDALADEWAAALAEAKPETFGGASGEIAPAARVEDASHLFPQLEGQAGPGGGRQDIDMILDIPVQLSVELGRTRIPI